MTILKTIIKATPPIQLSSRSRAWNVGNAPITANSSILVKKPAHLAVQLFQTVKDAIRITALRRFSARGVVTIISSMRY